MLEVKISKATLNQFEECRRWDQFNRDQVLREKIERGFIYLAYFDSDCLGYLRWDFFWNRLPYLCLIVVKKEQRGRGVGQQLLTKWMEDLKQKEYKFCLSSSQENEPPAVEWHLKQGFREIGRLATLNDDGSVEIFLRKELPS
jgi:ribosomal protein S18 acetylase RimI-like enzyme